MRQQRCKVKDAALPGRKQSKETKCFCVKVQERRMRTDNNNTKQVQLALPLDWSSESKQQRETSQGAKGGFWLRHRNSRKANRLKQQVWRRPDPQWRAKIQLTEVRAEKQLQLFLCIDMMFRASFSCLKPIGNVIANGVMFKATSQGVQKTTITLISLRHTLLYKRIQPDESGVRRWWKYSRTPQRSWARVPGE